MRTIVTKTEYAALKKRDISTISHWIADGKISKEALIGEGPRAKLWVERADANLARSLDPAQQSTQENPVALTTPTIALDAPRPHASEAVTPPFAPQQTAPLFDHLVGLVQRRRRLEPVNRGQILFNDDR